MRLHQDLLASLGWCLSAMNILSFFCILVICGRSFSQEQTYVVSAPKILRVGSFEKVVIQAFGYENEFSVNVAIKSYPDKQTVYSSGRVSLSSANKFQGSVTLMIQPKDLPGPGSSVHVYLEASSVHFTREKKMPVTYDNGYLFIQTDKPIYTPDQSVKVRVYSLNQEMKPAQRETVLTFVDPEGVKVDIIEENDFTGIVSFPDFKIPSNPKYGTWKIEAKYKKSFTTTAFTNFEVKEYAMPSFSVSIEPEYNFISFEKFEKFKITIQASYFYNKVVAHAEVFVRFGIIEANEKTMMPKAMHVTEMRNGVAEVNFNSSNAVRDIGRQSLEELNGAYLYIAASVLESEGGHGEEAEFYGVKFVLSPYKLNLVATPLFVKPGLPFSIKVQVKDTLNQPVGNLPVTLTANAVNEQMDSTHLVSGASESGRRQTSRTDGTALFIVNVPSDSKTLEFQVKTVDPSLSEENQATEHYEATAYSSLSKSYLYIDWASNHKMLHVGDHISINVYPSSHYIHKIYYYSYLILSKGKIISFGTQARINDTDYEHVSFQLTQDMVPSARLLVYYIVTGENTAELVADSVWLNIEQKCGNSLEVMLELEKSDLGCGAGGGQNNVNVFRLAGLTFLTNANADDSKEADEICAAIVRSKRFDFEEEIVKRASLYAIEAVRQCCMDGVRAYPVTETCAERTKRVQGGPKCLYAFKDCCEYANKLRQQEPNKVLMLARKQFEAFLELDKPEVRSYFPESWLWEVHQVPQGSKSLPVTLPDSLTTWEIQGVSISDKGICVADPLEVQVFKDVFLSMHIPYSVVRGEQIALKGSVYNYGTSTLKFCVKVAAGEGICLFGESSTGPQRIWGCKFSNIESSSISSVTVRLLPLELGLHTINFTLYTGRDSEILVKTLRVVPEGIKKELNAGFTLDPKGVYGSVRRRQDFRYRVPFNVVPKMKIDRTVSVKGQLMGEVISAVLKPEGVDFLTNLPKGSAEAELMSIVPVFYVYHYLEKTSNWDLLGTEILTAEVKMKRKMKEGIVSILSFRNKDFSYSMWKDRKPSTWLTAFALRIFGQVSAYIDLDHISVCNSLVWLTDHCQMSDGSFKELSSYQPVKLQGTLPKEAKEKALYLTAFTVIGIDKSVHMCPVQRLQDAKLKAEEYLLKNVQAAQSTFTLAITCYALALMDLNHPGTRLAFGKLKKEAFTKGEPPIYRFWKDTLKSLDTFTPNAGTAQMVETTAYALLTTLKGGDKIYANPVIRWLSEEQRFGGGFYSTQEGGMMKCSPGQGISLVWRLYEHTDLARKKGRSQDVSFQDTINALEALTEYSILAKHLSLDMNVKVAYKNHGDLHLYKLTEQNFIGRPVTVPLDEDIYVSTTGNTGLATVNVRTVYHTISTSDEICNFELTITPETEQDKRRQEGEIPQRLKACAKYKPGAREPRSESAHAVMDISLPSGVEADEEDLYVLATGVDQLIRSYEIKDGHIIIQIDSVPANKFFCVAFRINEIFRVGMLSPATFTVYEYHAPDKKCTIFYNPYGDDRLVKLCEGNECKCMEAECSQMRKKLDLSVSADTRKEVACQQDIAYVYKVKILSYKEEGSFIKYTATLLDVYKRGGALAQKNDEITFVKKNTCFDVVLNPGEQYLIMGKEALRIVVGFSFKYQYPLDSKTWIEWWPSNTACPSCKQFVATMEGFVEDLLIFGC